MIPLTYTACTTCAQAFEHAGDNAAGWAILFMLGVLVPILGTLAFVVYRFSRRAKAHYDPQFQDPFES